jgi:hypothetical protein
MAGIFVLVPFVWIALVVAFGLWRQVQAGKPIAPRVPAGADFGETMCSGRVLRGVLGALGGANNCLVVVVDRGRFCVSFAFPFNLLPFPGLGALNVDVPVASVARITPGRRLWQRVLRIDFVDLDRAPVELVVRDEARLVAALGPSLVAPGADRPLRSTTRPRFDLVFARAILAIVGTGLAVGGGTGLVQDLTLRANGTATTAVMVGYEGRRALVRYHAAGRDYTMASHFNGDWSLGETETVIYLPDNPDQATESADLLLAVLLTTMGVVFLTAALFGGRLIPGWS